MAVHPERWADWQRRQEQFQKGLELRVQADELLEKAEAYPDKPISATNDTLLRMVLDLDERLRKLEDPNEAP